MKLFCESLKQAFKENRPSKITFWDGSQHFAPRCLYRLLRRWRKNEYRMREADLIYREYQGGDFIDVGALYGWYPALLAPKAKPGSHFICIEPDPKAYYRLFRNVCALAKLFPHIKFWPIHSAAGNGSNVEITFPSESNVHPSFRPCVENTDVDTERFLSKGISLDTFCSTIGICPDFVKIDVEGAEIFVLEGMNELLDNPKLKIALEIHTQWQPSGTTVDSIKNLLKEKQFKSSPIEHAATSENVSNLKDSLNLSIYQLWKKS